MAQRAGDEGPVEADRVAELVAAVSREDVQVRREQDERELSEEEVGDRLDEGEGRQRLVEPAAAPPAGEDPEQRSDARS